MNPSVKEVERLLGLPDPRLVWEYRGNELWRAKHEKFFLMISKSAAFEKMNHGYSWQISRWDGSLATLARGSAHSLKEAKRGAQKGLRGLL